MKLLDILSAACDFISVCPPEEKEPHRLVERYNNTKLGQFDKKLDDGFDRFLDKVMGNNKTD